MPHRVPFRWLLLPLALSAAALAQAPARYFGIQVVDEATGRGVPLIELRTVDHQAFVTDSAGWVALDEPALHGEEVFFHVSGHGYTFPADGFGIRGKAVRVDPGKTVTLRIRRDNVAERLYRCTGAGIYRDAQLLGKATPLPGGLTARVMGCDSVQKAVYRGRFFWMWGDTLRPSYPLGNFHMTGAVSPLPQQAALPVSQGIAYNYFTGSDGFARGMAPVEGEGPTWLDGVTVLREGGGEQMFAAYAKIRPPLEVYRRGWLRYNDESARFEQVAEFPVKASVLPHGHPVARKVEEKDYIYYGDPFLLVRAPAQAAALRDLSRYEAYTCLKEGSTAEQGEVDRGPDGRVCYAWRRGTAPVTPEEQEKLIRAGKLRREEAMFRFADATGKPVVIHRGTLNWNAHRRRWVMIGTQIGGSSLLGEVWYAEAEQPEGPWLRAVKIVSHRDYSFYNPAHHPEFDEDNGRRIYFEGTYTHTFSGNKNPTPRYDYNQVMYRLDLDDPRLQAAR